MNIGEKLKNARINAGLTQEQSAEAFGVSRQTIYNWENEKTYPDILTVIKMSDVYNISLDHLLKNNDTASDYIDFLKESTNAVKSKRTFSELMIVMVYLIIFTFSILTFWCFISGSDALGYSLVFLYIIFPLTLIILSFLIGKNRLFGRLNWITPFVFGFSYMFAEYFTFNLANMISFNKINLPHTEMIFIGAVVSASGLLAGKIIRKLILKKS